MKKYLTIQYSTKKYAPLNIVYMHLFEYYKESQSMYLCDF